MYKSHKVYMSIIVIVLFITTFCEKIEYSKIAGDSITIISILLAVYLASFSSLITSDKVEKMKTKVDPKINTKSQLGVLKTYIDVAVASSILCILISCVVLLFPQNLTGICQMIYFIISSLGFSVLGTNIYLLILIYKFMSNRQLYG